MSWTEEREQRLKDLWEKGYTASQIAEMLGGGTTRNAVIGKAHRLKLAARVASKQSKSPKKQDAASDLNKQERHISKKNRFRSLLLDKSFPPENPKQLEELDNKNCRWPSQHHPNEKGFYFCGRPPVEGFSYCKLHVLFAFQVRDQKEELIDKEDDVPAFLEKKVKSAK